MADPVEGSTKDRIAEALRKFIEKKFGGNEKRAAEDLGYNRQRLHSYISRANFPGDEVFDLIRQRWALDLLNIDALNKTRTRPSRRTSEAPRQIDLPVRLANEGVEIVLERKGANIAVGIKISPDVKVA
jgi:hypothetical protein